MKVTERRTMEARKNVETKLELARQREDAFWDLRDKARTADHEKTNRLRKLRLAKEASERDGQAAAVPPPARKSPTRGA